MARRCDMCGKGPLVGNSVSHSNHKTKKRTLPNLQNVRVLAGATVLRVKLCTSCMKTGKLKRA